MSKEIDIEYYHQLALQKQKEHRKFLGNLKKKAPKKKVEGTFYSLIAEILLTSS